MWLARLERYFPQPIRERAAKYVRRVQLAELDENLIDAHVRGKDVYRLRIERHGRTLRSSCSCPYFQSTGPCKHLWAVLESAQQSGEFEGAEPPDLVTTLQKPTRFREEYKRPPPRPREPSWQQTLAALRKEIQPSPAQMESGAEILYILDVDSSIFGSGAYLDLTMRTRKRDGEWSKPRPLNLPTSAVSTLVDPRDRELMAILAAIAGPRAYYARSSPVPTRVALAHGSAAAILSKVFATGRAQLRRSSNGQKELLSCAWDDGPPYVFHLVVTPSDDEKHLVVRGELRRGEEIRPLGDRVLILAEGLIFFRESAALLEISETGFRWVSLLIQRGGELRVPAKDGDALAMELRSLPAAPPLDLPKSLQIEERRCAPVPCVRIDSPDRRREYSDNLIGKLTFDYEGVIAEDDDPRPQLPISNERRVQVRDLARERAASDRLVAIGFRREATYPTGFRWKLAPKRLTEIAVILNKEGWRVEADGKLFRTPGKIEIAVTSGIDWFDLSGEVHYGDATASLPQLLAAANRGDRFVTLDDGSIGLLPEQWLTRHRLVGELGTTEGDVLRFAKNQIGVLDALLAALPEAKIDEQLARARAALASFGGVKGRRAPRGFVGELRGYQREGLGWIEFLRDFGFGGCLADDMGLGKTIQVLALLEGRRSQKKDMPSLVVVPKSLIFNWRREAARFTPKLRVLEHHGLDRPRAIAELAKADLIVTTYGTMVRDIDLLRSIDLDYVILDEAQAIKNPRTAAAKAVRLLKGQHRLALTGTPIENRLSDLWSLFEFLNPGMLGASAAFKRFGEIESDESTEARTLLARALRPFILRRTKEQAAPDLPQKTEQIIYCELEGDERTRYDELRAHYRASLLGLVDERGMARSQMHILEALLRLRQAACHPGLLDRDQADVPSAKLAALLAQLDEVIAGGHKALVFSQFTSLLAIVRKHLDTAKIEYEYLDGRTRDRQAKVDRFQSDPSCSTFLVSLKAGGVGLNLTAAEYVFLLDPWWNPAVEAQAIDRTHRIGQSRPVIAYRLIGRDTVEEKILALQAQKRGLADAIIGADNAMLSRIGREELDLLLS